MCGRSDGRAGIEFAMLLLMTQTPVWEVRIDGGGNDLCYSMAFSPAGNPVVAGNYGDALYVAELDSGDGSFLWQYIFAFPGNGRSNVKSILPDPTDSAFVLGGTSYPYSGDDQSCGFVAKIRDGGTVWMYVDSADGCGRREGFSGVVIGGDGHYYAYGTDYETYSADLFTPSRRFVLKIDRGTGSKVWRYEPGGYSYTAAAPLSDGSIVAVGFGADAEAQRVGADGSEIWSITPDNGKFWAVAEAPNGHPVVAGIKDGDFYVAQLQRETGGVRWYYSRNGANNSDEVALGLASDGYGHMYAVGYLDNGINGLDAYIIKLDTLGNPIWEFSYNGPFNSDDLFRRVVAAPDGGIVAVGYSVGPGTGRDVLMVKLDPESGDTLWTFVYDSPYSLDDEARAVLYRDGAAYVCASSWSSPTDRDMVVLKVMDPTAVAETPHRSFTIVPVKGGLLIDGEGSLTVYDVTGRKVSEVQVSGRRRVKLRRGLWFVRFGGRVLKVLIP